MSHEAHWSLDPETQVFHLQWACSATQGCHFSCSFRISGFLNAPVGKLNSLSSVLIFFKSQSRVFLYQIYAF